MRPVEIHFLMDLRNLSRCVANSEFVWFGLDLKGARPLSAHVAGGTGDHESGHAASGSAGNTISGALVLLKGRIIWDLSVGK
jgi:hypothetical protein